MNTQSRFPSALFAAILAAAQLTASTPAQAADTTDSAVKYDSLFISLDANKDSYISVEEAEKLPRFADAFRQADENHDGRLSRDEFIKAHGAYNLQRAGAFAADSLITAKVKAALLRDPRASALSVSVETYYGEVLLSGFVADSREAQHVRDIAAGVSGVKQVRDLLVVKS
jgi:hyperosmotically inducible protein